MIGLTIGNLFLTLDCLAKPVYRGGEGSIWSYGSSKCHAMLTPFEGLPLYEEAKGVQGEGEKRNEERLPLACKANKLIIESNSQNQAS